MAVGNYPLPEFFPIQGLKIGTSNAGIKQTERADVTVFELCQGATVAAVFTTNAFCAAPVQIAKQHLLDATPRYLLVNTGNANAGTGEAGMHAAHLTVQALADATMVPKESVLPFSTGVIGEVLPAAKVVSALPEALNHLSEHHWVDAAASIMTTDTRPKGVTRQLSVADQVLTVSGISKGSGMIKPNMATMLAYIGLDARVSQTLLQQLLLEANSLSFNSITVDGDTSTNDSVVLMATGQSGLDLDRLSADDLLKVQLFLNEIFIELAQLIILDGEGATKFVHVKVLGGRTVEECKQLAFTVAESPLVKTALFASDANWGRILAAAGRAGLDALDVNKVSLRINEVLIAEKGGRAVSYTEDLGSAAMAKEEIVIELDLARGTSQATVWTSDLSHEYVTINAEYRT